ncbi:MAG: bifunctional (p)ppGpp synthetase/guanosine-3',5'-bis(diphosphate) 3'-pyrophosphohydrolase, partial [Acidobacteriota bacterium]|nr:bifunctional (p)ppGpp synthetase/guanosine-3',5'-bis(diphosphate) 3'-pyrophosphohydrolase [Acidobacteriota bacterium]
MATVRQAVPKADSLPAAASLQGPDSAPLPLPGEDAISQRFEALLQQVQANRPTEDVGLIRKAWEFCVQHHQGQMRASGEPYIIHPLEVAEVLAELKMDATAISAGLLHDAVEDTPATREEIQAAFGEQVAHIVEGVTKIDKIQFANRE